MKRLAVGCIHDSEGIVEAYKLYMISSLRELATEIVIICNGIIMPDEESKLSRYVDRIIVREDRGVDMGAFKHYFVNEFNANEWDEVILFNDSIYGPFVPWEDVFSFMEARNIDFWGIHEEKYNWESSYMSTFFIVYGKKLIRDKVFAEFWKNLKEPNVVNKRSSYDYEFYQTQLYRENGFRCSSWGTERGLQSKIPVSASISAYVCLKELGYPVCRCKSFSTAFYDTTKKALEFIQESTDYDINLILDHIYRLEKLGNTYPFSEKQLTDFIESHDKIYIFGRGLYASEMDYFFSDKGYSIAGYVVSNPKDGDIALADLQLEENDGIVVCVALRNRDEIEEMLLSHFRPDQILRTNRY